MTRPMITQAERRILDGFDRALDCAGNTHDFQRDVVPMLLDGRCQFWQHDPAAIVIRVSARRSNLRARRAATTST